MSSFKITTTAKQPNVTPFLPGRNATVVIFGAGKVSGSDDGTTYTQLVAGTASDLTVADITIPAYLKTDTGSAYLIAGA